MATNYCTAQHIADFLKIVDNTGVIITPSGSTDPKLAFIEDCIKRGEDEIDSRTQHAWRLKLSREIHDLGTEYEYGQGYPIHLHHRNVQIINEVSGDKIELWNGTIWENITGNINQSWNQNEDLGIINIIGSAYSIFKENRLRVTYRYGGEPLDGITPTVPRDIEEAAVKLASIKLLESAFAGRNIQFGQDRGVRVETVIGKWREDIDKIIERHAEWVHVEF